MRKPIEAVDVTTDLSALTPALLRARIAPLPEGKFASFPVRKEEEIRAFFERVTGRAYVRGSCFYQLTKVEVVQPDKAVLLAIKGEPHLYGGQVGRSFLGLPLLHRARVTPGDHGPFDVFVQAGSSTRKLVRGTRLLIDRALAGLDEEPA